jgi:hypothetical protein
MLQQSRSDGSPFQIECPVYRFFAWRGLTPSRLSPPKSPPDGTAHGSQIQMCEVSSAQISSGQVGSLQFCSRAATPSRSNPIFVQLQYSIKICASSGFSLLIFPRPNFGFDLANLNARAICVSAARYA